MDRLKNGKHPMPKCPHWPDGRSSKITVKIARIPRFVAPEETAPGEKTIEHTEDPGSSSDMADEFWELEFNARLRAEQRENLSAARNAKRAQISQDDMARVLSALRHTLESFQEHESFVSEHFYVCRMPNHLLHEEILTILDNDFYDEIALTLEGDAATYGDLLYDFLKILE